MEEWTSRLIGLKKYSFITLDKVKDKVQRKKGYLVCLYTSRLVPAADSAPIEFEIGIENFVAADNPARVLDAEPDQVSNRISISDLVDFPIYVSISVSISVHCLFSSFFDCALSAVGFSEVMIVINERKGLKRKI